MSKSIRPAVPVVVVYDLHANIGLEWLAYATAIVGYKTAPHTDFYERGAEGAVTYVAGMTDRFAFSAAVKHLGWDPSRLPTLL